MSPTSTSVIEMSDKLRSSRIRGFLVDITGVLYDCAPNSDGTDIPGSAEAVRRLYQQSKVRFVSNESTGTREAICAKLRRLGFDALQPEHIFTPAPIATKYVHCHGLRPHLLAMRKRSGLHMDNRYPQLCADIGRNYENSYPCVSLNQALSFTNLCNALRVLLRCENPILITLGNGCFYQRANEGPCLDTGAYAAALKFAVEGAGKRCQQVVIGKPEKSYFLSALEDMELGPDEVAMIGDDIKSDVSAAQQIGICGILVRTGKWRPEWEHHQTMKPDMLAQNLLEAVNSLLSINSD